MTEGSTSLYGGGRVTGRPTVMLRYFASMPNKHILKRLSGVQGCLMSTFESGTDMTSNNKGIERELFIGGIHLSAVTPTGCGLATDVQGKCH